MSYRRSDSDDSRCLFTTLASSTGIARVSERRTSHFTVFISEVLVHCNKYFRLQRLDEEDDSPPLNLHLFKENLFKLELFSMCRFAKKILPGHSVLLRGCRNMPTKVGLNCTIRHITFTDIQKVLDDLKKTKRGTLARRCILKIGNPHTLYTNQFLYPSILTVNSRPHLLHLYSTVTQLFRS